MNQINNQALIDKIKNFSLPKYNDIPNVGLYLEQTAKYISEYLEPLQQPPLTGSMISNYVKQGLISNPVKKQYDREQIGYLFFISIAKTIISIEDIKILIEIQKNTYPPETAYTYFETEIKSVINLVFGISDTIEEIGARNSDKKELLRNLIITVVHKVYLDMRFGEYKKTTD